MALEHADEICSLEFLLDGHLVSGNSMGEITLWDTVTGSRVRPINAHRFRINSLSASGIKLKLASGSDDKTVRVWDTTSWEYMPMFECDSSVFSVSLYPNADRVAACTEDMLYVWDTVTQQLIASKNLNKGKDVAISRDGKWLAVAADKIVSLYDATTLGCIWSRDDSCKSVSFSPASHQLACGYSSEVKVFDVPTRNLVRSFHHDYVERAVFSHNGTRLISGESCIAL